MKTAKTKTERKNKIKKESYGERVFDIFNVLFLVAISIMAVYPLWYILCGSFSHSSALMAAKGMILYPMGAKRQFAISWAAYEKAFSHPLIFTGYINSIWITVSATVLNIVLTSMCAYVLSRKDFLLKKSLTLFVMFTMFFNGGMIPTYIVYTKMLGLYNKTLSLIIPGAISVYNMIVMRTNFESIPDSLIESARIDGAGHMRSLFQIVLPLSKAIIAVMVLYYAVGHWNDWFAASIYLKDRSKFPLQLILREILIQNDTSSMEMGAGSSDIESISETIKYATIVIATVPILCVYPFLQKHFTKGVMIGAVKG